MSDVADQPQERTGPAVQPSNDTGNPQPVTGPFFQGIDWLSFGFLGDPTSWDAPHDFAPRANRRVFKNSVLTPTRGVKNVR